MPNLAYKIELPELEEGTKAALDTVQCVACGEDLTAPDADRQSWGALSEAMGLSSAELLCGACGEYLRGFFDHRK